MRKIIILLFCIMLVFLASCSNNLSVDYGDIIKWNDEISLPFSPPKEADFQLDGSNRIICSGLTRDCFNDFTDSLLCNGWKYFAEGDIYFKGNDRLSVKDKIDSGEGIVIDYRPGYHGDYTDGRHTTGAIKELPVRNKDNELLGLIMTKSFEYDLGDTYNKTGIQAFECYFDSESAPVLVGKSNAIIIDDQIDLKNYAVGDVDNDGEPEFISASEKSYDPKGMYLIAYECNADGMLTEMYRSLYVPDNLSKCSILKLIEKDGAVYAYGAIKVNNNMDIQVTDKAGYGKIIVENNKLVPENQFPFHELKREDNL